MKFFLLFFFLAILDISVGWSQSFPDLRFKVFTTSDGLRHNSIDGVVQDRHGYVWVITAAGLNRFDGVRFAAYPHRPDNPLSPPSNYISDLHADPKGDVWTASPKGIARFVYEKNHFERVPTRINSPDAKPLRLRVGLGYVWILYTNGIMCRVHTTTLTAEVYAHSDTIGIAQAVITDEDRKSLWIATTKGLYEFDVATRTYALRWKSTFTDEHRKMIGPLFRTSEGQLWFASYGGELVHYHPQTQQASVYTYILPDGQNGISLATDIAEIPIGTSRYVAIATFKGLVLFDRLTRHFTRQQQEMNPQSIPANYLTSLCVDQTGLLWVGSGRGLARSERVASNFTTRFVLAPDTKEEITALLPSSTGDSIWIGTTAGLGYYHTKNHQFAARIPLPGKRGVTTLFQDNYQRLWIGTPQGCVVYEVQKRRFLSIAGLRDAFGYNPVTVITADKAGQYWIGTNQGISLYDAQLRFLRNYAEADGSGLKGRYVNFLYPQATGGMWVGTKQLLQYDAHTQRFEQVGKGTAGLAFPLCIAKDGQNRFWFGTGNGMARYDSKTTAIKVYDEDNSQVASSVTSIGMDRQGLAWLWCADNLYRFDPSHDTYKIYRWADGLHHQANGGQKLIPAPDGGFYILLHKGFQYFHPQRMHQDTTQAPIVLSHLMIQDQFFTADANKLKDTLIELAHQQNMLCFQFSAMDFYRSDETRYVYQLEGVDKEWSSPIASQMITYPDLNDGEYTFRVRARNYDGYWQPDELRVRVMIRPPFWKTGWFLMGCAAAVLGVGYAVYRSRIDKIRRENALTIKALDAEIKALRAQLNPHFTFNSLNAIQNLILDEQNDLASGYLAKMARLMRFILINSEKDLISLHDEIELLRLYLEMEALRFDHSFTYEIQYNGKPPATSIMIPGMIFQPFIENAIWHGLMQREGKKTLTITFTTHPETRQMIGQVEDNGIGRQQALQNSIFSEHKSRGMELIEQRLAAAERQTGSRSFIEIIDLKDVQGQPTGTRIKITLPLIVAKNTGKPVTPL